MCADSSSPQLPHAKSQEIDDEIANQIIGVMLYLDSEDNSKPIYLYINCPGGSVIAGLALFDTMQHVKSPIVTINLGLAVRTLNMRHVFRHMRTTFF